MLSVGNNGNGSDVCAIDVAVASAGTAISRTTSVRVEDRKDPSPPPKRTQVQIDSGNTSRSHTVGAPSKTTAGKVSYTEDIGGDISQNLSESEFANKRKRSIFEGQNAAVVDGSS